MYMYIYICSKIVTISMYKYEHKFYLSNRGVVLVSKLMYN